MKHPRIALALIAALGVVAAVLWRSGQAWKTMNATDAVEVRRSQPASGMPAIADERLWNEIAGRLEAELGGLK